MNIRISKGERSITLLKREKQTLADAKALLTELAKQHEPGLSDLADVAADRIGEVERSLENAGLEVSAPY